MCWVGVFELVHVAATTRHPSLGNARPNDTNDYFPARRERCFVDTRPRNPFLLHLLSHIRGSHLPTRAHRRAQVAPSTHRRTSLKESRRPRTASRLQHDVTTAARDLSETSASARRGRGGRAGQQAHFFDGPAVATHRHRHTHPHPPTPTTHTPHTQPVFLFTSDKSSEI